MSVPPKVKRYRLQLSYMFVCDVRRHLDLVCIPITFLIEIFSYLMALLQLKVIIINHSSSSVRDENDKN